jgi:ATP-dependent DNA helicase RecQ
MTQAFDLDSVTGKMNSLFIRKEKQEIGRIHQMVNFFESGSCISRQLAGYFGEHIEKEFCGHCSYCKSGKAVIKSTTELKKLSGFNYDDFTQGFIQAIGDQFTEATLTKFLCGIYTPAFSKLKIKTLPHFGVLERYPFMEVKNWIEANKQPT